MSNQYATYEDMIKRYDVADIARLSDRDQSRTLNIDSVNEALRDATDEINSYLVPRYKLPLSIVSRELIQITCVIARYWMESGQNTEKAIEDYKRMIKRLEMLKDGETSLGLSDDDLAETPEVHEGGAWMESSPVIWDRKKSQGYI